MKIGVLALQGDFDAHRKRLEQLGADVVLVRKPEQLDEVDALVIPGGESSTFLKLLGEQGFDKLREFVRAKPTFGTCAGAILLATQIENPFNKAPHEFLSDREYQTLLLISSGKTISQIAEELSLSVPTVSTYRARILDKMGMKTNAELANYGIRNSLV